jgi:serine phosphatase RsbU (regulator of sigma subunit)
VHFLTFAAQYFLKTAAKLYLKNALMRFFLLLFCFWAVFLCETASAQTEFFSADGKKLSVQDLLENAEKKESEGDFRSASDFLNKAAMLEWEKKNYSAAIQYFSKSLKNNENIQNKQGMLGIYSNLAMIYADQKDYERSYSYFEKTLAGRRQGKDKESLFSALINASVVLNNLKRHAESAELLEEALEISRSISDTEKMKSCYGMLAETYEKAGNTPKMIQYFELYRSFHELVQRDKVEKYRSSAEEAKLRAQLLEMQNKNQELVLFNKQLELQKQQEKLKEADSTISNVINEKNTLYLNLTREQLANKIYEQEAQYNLQILAKEKQVRNLLIGVLILMMLLGGLFMRMYQEKRKTNKRLEEQNFEISKQQEQILLQKENLEVAYKNISDINHSLTQSIAYAKRIQTAALPNPNEISYAFKESFVFFKPRDVVSGDFYWFYQNSDTVFFAVVDCTGHGVPGAFMSMIGINLLNEITSHGITQPDEILRLMNLGITMSLRQNETENRDGMEAAIIAYNKAAQKITFAGARRPLLLVRNGEMTEISPDKFPIGGQYIQDLNAKVDFKAHEIDAQENDVFFMYSDGFQDQFGGAEGRKFMYKNFKKLLVENAHLPLNEQRDILEITFNNWKNENTQTDDVLVAAFKI